jgi:hypothetical protein
MLNYIYYGNVLSVVSILWLIFTHIRYTKIDMPLVKVLTTLYIKFQQYVLEKIIIFW